jgi:hypothetical protein
MPPPVERRAMRYDTLFLLWQHWITVRVRACNVSFPGARMFLMCWVICIRAPVRTRGEAQPLAQCLLELRCVAYLYTCMPHLRRAYHSHAHSPPRSPIAQSQRPRHTSNFAPSLEDRQRPVKTPPGPPPGAYDVQPKWNKVGTAVMAPATGIKHREERTPGYVTVVIAFRYSRFAVCVSNHHKSVCLVCACFLYVYVFARANLAYGLILTHISCTNAGPGNTIWTRSPRAGGTPRTSCCPRRRGRCGPSPTGCRVRGNTTWFRWREAC